MSKEKKHEPESMAQHLAKHLGVGQPEKKRKVYDELGRAQRVLASQGVATGLVEYFPAEYRKRLAALCDEHGVVNTKVTTEFPKIRRELINEHKAAVKGLEPNE